ncbi:1,4-alpha-glucan branching protein GlgB [Horticoccus luteus]|uniref:1,4-alpha-glucan branching enzyme GlgB n=1 Tax=Horticoccus luteus TaxID=2862869 RepID=A0A8F9TWX5_9BACT|nr:1,4-alpha-glucan branching protein GlgB [Horticoccus luteus]QYM80625.1 1,4-alpha-glucan branching protein GlgB [Horticoccus luteus]
MAVLTNPADLSALLDARYADPHTLVGMHPFQKGKTAGVLVRALVQNAVTCAVVDPATNEQWELTRTGQEGFFEGVITKRKEVFRYQLRVGTPAGELRQFFDPYAFLPTLDAQDLYLFNEGNEHRVHHKLGSHVREMNGVVGTAFAVWAPAAKQVSLLGNFNGWDARYHPMRPLGSSGVWELFVPGLAAGELYKFSVRDQAGRTRMKTDPYGTYFEPAPNNAAIVCDVDRFAWGDDAWLAARRAQAGRLDRPISIYEVHLGSWRRKPEDNNRPLTYRELAVALGDYVTEMGYTHIEVLPVAEYPFSGSWGYQVTGFFAPTHRFGRPEDFAWFVDHLHQRGIGVILDWVPAHFPRDSFALAEFDGTHVYEHADPRQGAHMDWGTLIFNYGRNEVRCFLTASALAWCERYHVDGLRVDAVASMLYLDYSRKAGEWLPNRFGGRENLEAIEFLKTTNDLVRRYHPGVLMIAEESTSFPQVSRPTSEGGLGFDFKWNMGLMHDTLSYFSREPAHRKWHQNDLTFGMLYQYAENFISVYSHDEVVHGKGSMLYKMGAWHIPQKAANLRALYAHVWAYPGKKLLFMGCDFGQSHEWNHDASLDWHLCQFPDHEGIRLLVRDLNRLYRDEAALGQRDLTPQGFRWVSCTDADAQVIAYLRIAEDERTLLLVVGHFSGATRAPYRVGVPRRGFWREVINSNSEYYGGTGLGNGGGRMAEEVGCDGYSQSLELTLPPLSTTIFKWTAE